MPHDEKYKLIRRVSAAAIVAAGAFAGCASAQTMDTNSASMNGGWGRYAGQENHAIDVATRDQNGNLIIVDGMIQDGSDSSTYTETDGAGSTYSGAGSSRRWSNATAIGNNLQVITQGNYNTVIVNSTQTNNGDVTATNTDDGSLNGELDLND